MRHNVLIVGSPGSGKTKAAERAILDAPDEAVVLCDPHTHSLADGVLRLVDRPHVLFDHLSDLRHPLGYDLLVPSDRPGDEGVRDNLAVAAGFTELLMRRRNGPGGGGPLTAAPLTEEWTTAAIDLFLAQRVRLPIALLPRAFEPTSDGFRTLLAGCTRPEVRDKFAALARLTPRALRAEVGAAARLLNALFRDPSLVLRAEGGFDLGGFLQRPGLLVIERGEEIDDDAARVLMGTVVRLVVRHARRRPKPYPRIRIYLDEATNAGLIGPAEVKFLAEMRKYGLFFTVIVQNLDFPCPPEHVQQLCTTREYFQCSTYELARRAAVDIVGGLPATEQSRAERIAEIAADVMSLAPGWRWVRDRWGSTREYLPLPENPWPDWPGLREAKFQEKLSWIRSRPEYRRAVEPPSSPSSSSSSPPPPNSSGSSPAERFKRG